MSDDLDKHGQGAGRGGAARGYSWEPFEPGNTVSTWHGAKSERRIGPLAERIEQTARGLPSWPSYLDDAAYGPAVASWARAEAIVELLWRYLSERDLDETLSDTSTDKTITEQDGDGKQRRISAGRRTRAALDLLERAEGRAARARASLGLDPMSRARLGRDVAASQVDMAQLLSQLRETAEGGGDSDDG